MRGSRVHRKGFILLQCVVVLEISMEALYGAFYCWIYPLNQQLVQLSPKFCELVSYHSAKGVSRGLGTKDKFDFSL